ncbi:uncharacterized protein LOC131156107 [Malania oleifera]|uniref:uncharacterized protein LOC131156107 n=1 Tax=Malania oleifera TaxID=397392 RepID=UPI0025ADC501|nr:uncharacterized protein LOC131156107 [Malania oleifera]
MGWKKCEQNVKMIIALLASFATFKEPFHLLTLTLLSLLLPLSFLLLSRLSIAHYLLTLNPPHQNPYFSPLLSIFLYTNPTLLHALVSIVLVASLVHGFTGRSTTFLSESPRPIFQPHLYVAWAFLSTLQVCVCLGIEGSMSAGVEGFGGFGNERSLFSGVVFFIGLHEAMCYWSRMVVKPVVDDTVFGVAKEEKWAERVAAALSVGGLWWWRLRDEVGFLVMVVEIEKKLSMGAGLNEFVGWWLYYLTVTIGMVRVVKGIMWVGMILLCREVERNNQEPRMVEDKV